MKLLTCAKGNPCYIPILLATFYGMRRSEAAGLQWSSVDFENNKIHIDHKAYEQSINGTLVVKISDEMKTESSRAFKKSYSREWKDCVCVNPKGEILRPDYITGHFKKFLEQNGLRQIRFHDLRHTCASFLVAENISMKQIQLWLGHSTFSTTADIYAHLNSHALDESAECISVLLMPEDETAVEEKEGDAGMNE